MIMQPMLFRPFELRGRVLPNRIMVSPMSTYSAKNGFANDFHLVHLGRFALGGAGLVVAEATAIEERGRTSHGDLGLWRDDQAEALRSTAAFLRDHGAVPGIQLAHAGRKAAAHAPWDGGGPLTEEDGLRGSPPWKAVGPTSAPAGPGWQFPSRLSPTEIADIAANWARAARRAVVAGFEVLNIHGAHGYLLHSFLSPISNTRTDAYGGSANARMRFAIEVIEAIRAAVPDEVPIIYRTSAVDGVDGGLTLDDTIRFAREMKSHGVDLIDTSSGAITANRTADTRIPRGYAFHAPYSAAIRRGANIPSATVGLIVNGKQAEEVLQHGDADLVAIGRAMLEQPHWAHMARAELGGPDFSHWHQEAGWWLGHRQRLLDRLKAEGETPASRYEGAAHPEPVEA